MIFEKKVSIRSSHSNFTYLFIVERRNKRKGEEKEQRRRRDEKKREKTYKVSIDVRIDEFDFSKVFDAQ